jgi:hypothetical protein
MSSSTKMQCKTVSQAEFFTFCNELIYFFSQWEIFCALTSWNTRKFLFQVLKSLKVSRIMSPRKTTQRNEHKQTNDPIISFGSGQSNRRVTRSMHHYEKTTEATPTNDNLRTMLLGNIGMNCFLENFFSDQLNVLDFSNYKCVENNTETELAESESSNFAISQHIETFDGTKYVFIRTNLLKSHKKNKIKLNDV